DVSASSAHAFYSSISDIESSHRSVQAKGRGRSLCRIEVRSTSGITCLGAIAITRSEREAHGHALHIEPAIALAEASLHHFGREVLGGLARLVAAHRLNVSESPAVHGRDNLARPRHSLAGSGKCEVSLRAHADVISLKPS